MVPVSLLTWDPQLRGTLIVLTGVLVLCGSTTLVLTTNVGAKVGILLAAAGLAGWLMLLNIIWLGYGIGYKGVIPGWQVKEVITGDLVAHSTTHAVVGTPGNPSSAFPQGGWVKLKQGSGLLATATPAADNALIPPAAGAKAVSAFPPPFKTTQDYLNIGGYTKGGHNYLINLFGYKIYWRVRHHQIYFRHQPHYVIIQAEQALPSVTLAGAATTLPAADPSKPVISIVMLRDVGSLRLPPILLGTSAFLIFAVMCWLLHEREKDIARRKAEEQAGGRPPSRELQPA
jgi:hypothetical protein